MITVEEVDEGDVVVVDGGFTCIAEGSACEVKRDEGGLYIECSEGHHYLEGQRDGNTYVGLSAATIRGSAPK